MTQTDIYVVDDERVIAETLAIILRRAGYSVEVFTDPHAALRRLNQPPRLLLTDQNMPTLSGCSVAALFLQTSRSTAVLMFSADLPESEPEWQYVRRQARQSILLCKPLHPVELLQSIERLVGFPAKAIIPNEQGRNAPSQLEQLSAPMHA